MQMPSEPQYIPQPPTSIFTYSRMLAGFGAMGVALQNYQAVAMSLSGLANSLIPASRWLDWGTQLTALTTGGIGSGMVNFYMNVELLDDFYNRINSNEPYQYTRLSLGKKIQYFAGIFVFVVTGILFGLLTFTFAMEGPLAILSIAAGVCVAIIMTIQELETWFKSWDPVRNTVIAAPLSSIQIIGKWLGHVIAAGNVLALSLLFTLSLAQGLMALQVAAFPALMIGLAVAFTFGAFTEYYFYNFYLSDFCKDLGKNLSKMMQTPNAWFGLICVTVNASVNGALTYAGVELLSGVLIAANISIPPLVAITALAVVCAVFAGSASFILGLDFWIRQNPVLEQNDIVSTLGTNAANEATLDQTPGNAKLAHDPRLFGNELKQGQDQVRRKSTPTYRMSGLCP